MGIKAFRSLLSPSFSGFSAVENDTNGGNLMVSNKSALKDFLVSIAGMTGDLSNITAPPFVLDPKSVVEIPAFWAENPAMFVAPATSDDPLERALLVLKGFLGGIKSQCYMGHSEEEGVKKPLNAFLGELFIGQWDDEKVGTTRLVSEQVSHHPPITACRVWNAKHGVIAEGYNRQRVTFAMSSLSVHVDSTGFALKTLEKYDEHYLLPLPDFRVKGVLSGAPYPETYGDWYIPSTNGYISKISFTGGKGLLGGGKKHEFHAVLYKEDDGPKKPLYTMEGCWNTEFTIRDERQGKVIETYNVAHEKQDLPQLQIPSLEEMDPWESRRAWHDTQEAIRHNDLKGVNAAKSYLEQGQRNMRKEEETNGTTWKQLFFTNTSSNTIVERLMSKIPGQDFNKSMEATNGAWHFNPEAYQTTDTPYHPDLEPDNLKEGEDRIYRNGSRASFQSSRGGTPRGSIDQGRPSIDSTSRRGSIPSPRPHPKLNEKVGAVENGRHVGMNGMNGANGIHGSNGKKMDIGRESQNNHTEKPTPRMSQSRSTEEELDSGVNGLSLKDKVAVEDMLRDAYSNRR